MVPATREGGKWVAYVPNDRTLEEGVYQLQAVAQDQAGNESSTDRFRSGQPAVIPIQESDQRGCCTDGPGATGAAGGPGVGVSGSPSALGPDTGTIETKIDAGALKKVKVKPKLPSYCKKPRTKAQKKRCAKARKPRYRQQYVNKLKVPFGKKALIRGSLTSSTGAPVADGTIDVITTPSATGGQARVIGAVTTNRSGAFSYTAPAGYSRKVTFRFRGLADYRRSEGNVDLLVPAAATIKSSKRQVANGQSVAFSGKLRGKPLPARGKVVDLQVFYRGKWRTFGTPQGEREGPVPVPLPLRGHPGHYDLQVPGAARAEARTRSSSATRRSSRSGCAGGRRRRQPGDAARRGPKGPRRAQLGEPLSRSKALMDPRRSSKAVGLAAGASVLLPLPSPRSPATCRTRRVPTGDGGPCAVRPAGARSRPARRPGRVRVRIALDADPVGDRARREDLRPALAGRLEAADQRALRRDPEAGVHIANRQERLRDLALARVASGARRDAVRRPI